MKRKVLIIIGATLALLLIFIMTNLSTQNDRDKELKVKSYFPKEEMIKKFSGGFENSGFTQTIDRIKNEKSQIKQVDTGTGVIVIYEVTDENISLIYTKEVSNGEFKEDYLDNIEPNMNKEILKAPLEVGTKWNNEQDGEFQITGINVKVKTPAGKFYAIEVTYINNDFVSKKYYVKNLGLVKEISKEFNNTELIDIMYINDK